MKIVEYLSRFRRGHIAFFAGVIWICSGVQAYAESNEPTRTINLVYDDSGSMIRLGDRYVDTWCQAKYAVEVVGAMLGERDTLNVYYMSDYDGGTAAGPRLQLHGSRDASVVASNVAKIHETVTPFGNTPFNAVRKASTDLKKATTDERWLVVLTDGEFEDGRMSGSEVESYYHQFVADGRARVIMLAMGPEAATIAADEDKGIYFAHASSTKEILPHLTKICNRIFQRNALKVSQNNRNYKLDFGVPMQQLIVFAQGRDTKIGEYITSGDKQYAQSSNVHVTYSKQSSVQNPAGTVVADDLNGYVATFDGEFEPGSYILDVSQAESIDVYYKPNVAINAYLYDLDGNEVTDSADIVNGKYKLEFGFVNATTSARVTDTSLLGNIEYDASLTNTATDGTKSTVQVSSGDSIVLKEGIVDIDVTARYLDYNTVHTKLNYEVFFRNELTLNIADKPEYSLTKDGLQNADKPMVVSVKMKDGDVEVPLTPEQWVAMPLPKVTTSADVGEFTVKKSDQPGEFYIYPSLGEKSPMQAYHGDVPLVVSGGFDLGKSSAAGRIESSYTVRDDITDFERFMDWLQQNWQALLGWIIGLFVLIGWIPGVKKYFPGSIKSRPLVRVVVTNGFQKKDSQTKGKFDKAFIPRFMPYMAQTGTYQIDRIGFIKLELKACGGRSILVKNKNKFLKKPEYDFGGKVLDKSRPLKITDGTQIKYTKDNTEYSFKLNTDK